VDEGGYVRKYDKTRKSKLLNGVDIGFFIVNKKVLNLMPIINFSFEERILPILVKQNQLAGYQTEHRYYYISNVDSLEQAEEFFKPQRVIFLDRDGVINRKPRDGDYVKSWDEFTFIDGVIEALKILATKGYDIYIVSNQRGIALGVMTDNELNMIHANMLRGLKVNGINIKGIYYCPHDINDNCGCRKPKAGMLFKAASDHNIDLTKALLVGDSDCDMEAGAIAGCKSIRVTPSSNSILSIVKELV
jgi:D-glycero-D-manno-heptose 1,7-bisphosphate phosphatase